MTNNDTQPNDFNDEILVKDESGEFKILSHGEFKPYQEKVRKPLVKPSTKLPVDTGMEEPMLQPPPPVVRKETASFYFHPEDEEEVAKFKTALTGPTIGKRYSLDKVVNKVIENYQLSLDELLKSRLRNIIFSYLRDRRTLIDFQEALVRSSEDGGMNFSQEQVEKISNFLKEIKEKVETERGLVVDEEEEGQVITSPIKTVKEEPLRPEKPGLKPVPKVEKPQPEIKKEVKEVPPKKRLSFQRPVKKGKITDVKKEYKLFGPVEELASLNLQTFRQLGATTSERAEKVVRRIESLVEESLGKKAAGLKAWRSCPLYRMYIAVGQAGMEHELAVSKIIEQYQTGGKEILTLEEFEAITDINRQLRF